MARVTPSHVVRAPTASHEPRLHTGGVRGLRRFLSADRACDCEEAVVGDVISRDRTQRGSPREA